MKTDDDQNEIGQVVERFKMWGAVMKMLARPKMAAQLIQVLEANDLQGFEALLEPTRVYQVGGCIDIYETITRLVNFGPGHWEECCEAICFQEGFLSQELEGKLYSLPDGSNVYVSERIRAEYCDRAHRDPAWLEQNKELLRALGLVRCFSEWVQDDILVTVDRNRTLCFPTVTHPYDRGE